jgi:pyruvate kinase
MPEDDSKHTIDRLIHELRELRDSALALERDLESELAAIPLKNQASARNLVHYLAVRQHDLREIQDELAELGLSSLGRLERYALASVDSVLAALSRLCEPPEPLDLMPAPPVDFRTGTRLLAEHTEALLGTASKGRSVRVMVTMSSEAADDPGQVRDLVAAGMDVMRINCAHDDADVWRRMVDHLRRAEREGGPALPRGVRPCRPEAAHGPGRARARRAACVAAARRCRSNPDARPGLDPGRGNAIQRRRAGAAG